MTINLLESYILQHRSAWDPLTQKLYDVMIMAVRDPGGDFLVEVDSKASLMIVFEQLSKMIALSNMIDSSDCISEGPRGPVIELNNGSSIELTIKNKRVHGINDWLKPPGH